MISPKNQFGFGLKGRMRCFVVDHLGKVVKETPWYNNLLLDAGLNRLDTVYFADLFTFCCRGTGATVTREDLTANGTYSLVTNTLTRITGTRDFTINDVGRLVKPAVGSECIVTGFTSATIVSVRAVGSAVLANFTTQTIKIYYVNQTALTTGVDVHLAYGADAGDNSTTDHAGNGTRVLRRTFAFGAQSEQLETVPGTNDYSWTATTLTRTGGTRDFTTADVGKYIEMVTGGQYAQISGFTSATVVTVDRSATGTPTGDLLIYGFKDYKEFGFSNVTTTGANLNIRVFLDNGSGAADPVSVLGENPETPGHELKVQYELTITLQPQDSTAGVCPITDVANAMSADKNGDFVLEKFSLSRVDTSGETSSEDGLTLEPAFEEAKIGLSASTAALVPLAGPVRQCSFVVQNAPDAYVADSFLKAFDGRFTSTDAVGTTWRCLGLYDAADQKMPFVFKFDTNQTKASTHSLIAGFEKSWNRALT